MTLAEMTCGAATTFSFRPVSNETQSLYCIELNMFGQSIEPQFDRHFSALQSTSILAHWHSARHSANLSGSRLKCLAAPTYTHTRWCDACQIDDGCLVSHAFALHHRNWNRHNGRDRSLASIQSALSIDSSPSAWMGLHRLSLYLCFHLFRWLATRGQSSQRVPIQITNQRSRSIEANPLTTLNTPKTQRRT